MIINTKSPSIATVPSTGAYRTVIENIEVQDGPEDNNTFFKDEGKATQFISCAGGNRVTDYIMKDLSDVKYYGSETDSSSFIAGKMNSVAFNPEYEGKVGSTFDVRNFTNIYIGNNSVNNTGTTVACNTFLRGSNVSVNLGTVSPTPGQVLSSSDDDGKLQWKTAFNIYENNGWINSSTPAINLIPDNKLRTLYTQSGSYSDPTYNSTSVLFTRNGNPSFDIMYLYSGTRNATRTALNDDQSVVIGANSKTIATNPNNAGYKLLVHGKVKVKDEVYILNTAAHWADYVFAPEYKLKSLSEVESFINKNGHLPNMPSAKEIETNGIPMAEITTKQQEKIEELTLYIIEQDKKIEALQKMKEEMDSLKKLVEKLNKN
jgi:hypothetical protein